LDALLSKVASFYKTDVESLKTKSKSPVIVKIRSVFCYLAVRKLDRSCTAIARKLNISQSTVSKAVIRGQGIVHEAKVEKVLLEY